MRTDAAFQPRFHPLTSPVWAHSSPTTLNKRRHGSGDITRYQNRLLLRLRWFSSNVGHHGIYGATGRWKRGVMDRQFDWQSKTVLCKQECVHSFTLLCRHCLRLRIETDPSAAPATSIAYAHHRPMAGTAQHLNNAHIAAIFFCISGISKRSTCDPNQCRYRSQFRVRHLLFSLA